MPSKGIIFPICTLTRSPALTSEVDTRMSCSPWQSQTFPTFKDILLAKSSTDFLWVHSSKISPIPRRNIIEPAVFILFLAIETPIAVASRTGTSIFLLASVLTPFQRYLTDFVRVIHSLIGFGRNILLAPYKNTLLTSLSQYSLFNSLPEFCKYTSGTSTLLYLNDVSNFIISSLDPI